MRRNNVTENNVKIKDNNARVLSEKLFETRIKEHVKYMDSSLIFMHMPYHFVSYFLYLNIFYQNAFLANDKY